MIALGNAYEHKDGNYINTLNITYREIQAFEKKYGKMNVGMYLLKKYQNTPNIVYATTMQNGVECIINEEGWAWLAGKGYEKFWKDIVDIRSSILGKKLNPYITTTPKPTDEFEKNMPSTYDDEINIGTNDEKNIPSTYDGEINIGKNDEKTRDISELVSQFHNVDFKLTAIMGLINKSHGIAKLSIIVSTIAISLSILEFVKFFDRFFTP